MKIFSRLLYIFLLSQTLFGFSQSFAPLGATWVYEYYNGDTWPPFNGQITIKVIGDTAIQGQSCKILLVNFSGTEVLSQKIYNENVAKRYLYETGGKVYLYNKESILPFNLLYDFNAAKNESWTIYGDKNSCINSENNLCEVKVDSLKEENYDNKMFKVQYVSPRGRIGEDRTYFFHGGKILSNIGGYFGFFPQASYKIDWNNGGALRCYSDSKIGTIKFGTNCDGIVGIRESTLFNRITTTVSDGKIKVSGIAATELSITIYSTQGVAVFQSVVPVKENVYEIVIDPSLKQGIYVVKITTEGNNQKTTRFLIQ